jgi:ketosteroid isomerase-like protein
VSQENVEVVRRAFDAFDRRDVDGLVDLTTAHVEWFPAMPGIVAGDSFRGRVGVEQYFEGLAETWVEYRSTVEALRDLGDRVLALGRLEGRGRGSFAPVTSPQGTVFEFCGTKISRFRTYLDHAEALKAVGLEE